MVNLTELLSRSDGEETAEGTPSADDDSDGMALDPTDTEPTAIEPPATDVDDGGSGHDGPTTTELQARVTDIEDELEDTSDEIRRLTTSQNELGDTVEEMNDTLRELAGMYDEAMAASNPFIDGPDHDSPAEATADPDSEPADDESPESSNDAVVSFEDLIKEDHSADDNTSPTPETTEPSESPTPSTDTAHSKPPTDAAVTLETVPEGYAADVLLLEWLSTLTAVGGPAGALQAIDHYEEVGWISTTVRRHLIDLLGGPSLDVFVDPTQPDEPTARQHAQSYEYLQALQVLQDL